MRQIILAFTLALAASAPCAAVEFLGVQLCRGSVDTSVVLPAGSGLTLESVEVGRHGGLLMLLRSSRGDVLDNIDDLMTAYTGSRGAGSEDQLQWSGNGIAAYAQIIKKGRAALAVSTNDDCLGVEAAPSPEPPVEKTPEAEPVKTEAVAVAATGATAGAAAAAAPTAASALEPAAVIEPTPAGDFRLKGRLKHAAAEDGRVEVMGIVVNRSGTSYTTADFDLSLYDAAGELICVDTISVPELKNGQERAFRRSIRCADYAPDAVRSWKIQFAGGS